MRRPLEVRYTLEAADAIRRFHPGVRVAIRQAIRALALDPEAGSPLELELEGFRAFRVGRYRVIFRTEPGRLVILIIGQRRDVYETAVRLLTRPPRNLSE